MVKDDYSASFVVQQDPQTAYEAIVAVRDWWGGDIEGSAQQVGDEFAYRYKDLHYSRQRVTELVPGSRVVWHVTEGNIYFVANQQEWTGTDLVFEITPKGTGSEVRLTHIGLVPAKECFNDCSTGWNYFFGGSLKSYISSLPIKAPASAA